MPLTPEEQRELDQINRELSGGSAGDDFPFIDSAGRTDEPLPKGGGAFTAENLAKVLPPLVGSLAVPPIFRGAKVLSKLPEAARLILGAGVGAGAGSLAGQEAQKRGLLPGKGPDSFKDQLATAGAEAGLGATGEGAGLALAKLLNPALKRIRPFDSAVTEQGRRAAEQLQEAGLTVPAAAVSNKGTRARLLDIAENIAEGSVLGGPVVQNQKDQAKSFFLSKLESVTDDFFKGASKEELGDIVQGKVAANKELFREARGKLYDEIDRVIGGASVDYRPMKEKASKLLKEAMAGDPNPARVKVLRRALAKPDVVTFRDAQNYRSDLLERGRELNDSLPGKTGRAVSNLAKDIDSAMETAAASHGGKRAGRIGEGQTPLTVLELWRGANNFNKAGHEVFGNAVLKKIANDDPDKVLKTILQDGRPVTTRRAREAIHDPEVWRGVQGEFLNDVMTKADTEFVDISTSKTFNEVSGEKVLARFRKFSPDNLKELFPNGEHKAFEDFARSLALMQRKQPDAKGRMGIQFIEAGAAVTLMSGRFTGPALRILMAPPLLAKALASKTFSEILTTGFKPGIGTERALTTAMKAMTFLQQNNIPFKVLNGDESENPGVLAQLGRSLKKQTVSPKAKRLSQGLTPFIAQSGNPVAEALGGGGPVKITP